MLTVEDHGIEGGFGSCVLEACHERGLDTRLLSRLAIPCRWIYQGSRSDQLEEAGLDSKSIARTIRSLLDRSRAPLPPAIVSVTAKNRTRVAQKQ